MPAWHCHRPCFPTRFTQQVTLSVKVRVTSVNAIIDQRGSPSGSPNLIEVGTPSERAINVRKSSSVISGRRLIEPSAIATSLADDNFESGPTVEYEKSSGFVQDTSWSDSIRAIVFEVPSVMSANLVGEPSELNAPSPVNIRNEVVFFVSALVRNMSGICLATSRFCSLSQGWSKRYAVMRSRQVRVVDQR